MDDKTKIIRFLIRKSFHVGGIYDIDLRIHGVKIFNKFIDFHVEITHCIDIKLDIVIFLWISELFRLENIWYIPFVIEIYKSTTKNENVDLDF